MANFFGNSLSCGAYVVSKSIDEEFYDVPVGEGVFRVKKR